MYKNCQVLKGKGSADINFKFEKKKNNNFLFLSFTNLWLKKSKSWLMEQIIFSNAYFCVFVVNWEICKSSPPTILRVEI